MIGHNVGGRDLLRLLRRFRRLRPAERRVIAAHQIQRDAQDVAEIQRAWDECVARPVIDPRLAVADVADGEGA